MQPTNQIPTLRSLLGQASQQQQPQTIANAASFRPQNSAISDTDLARSTSLIGIIASLFRTKVVGQDSLLLNLLVALISNGHILLESCLLYTSPSPRDG